MVKNNPAPVVPYSLNYYLNAYFSLCSERLNSLSAIPVTRIFEYSNHLGIDNKIEFVSIIESMDAEYLQHMAKVQQTTTNNDSISKKNAMLADRAKAHGIG